MKRKSYLPITQAALIAALYVALTFVANFFGLSSGAIQLRLSEALTILPFFTKSAVPGLFVGCIIANLLTGCAIWDIIFGSIATLLGAIFTYLLRKHKFLAPIPPIIANTLIVPFVIAFVYGSEHSIPFLMVTVGIGEILSCGVLGMALLFALYKHKERIFK
ncbi:MAG: QueT transporter family protein [Clostridia bacterium]|nr:QueT transporter family protein [Clostridia bacterium]